MLDTSFVYRMLTNHSCVRWSKTSYTRVFMSNTVSCFDQDIGDYIFADLDYLFYICLFDLLYPTRYQVDHKTTP